MMGVGWWRAVLGSDLIQDPSGLRVEALPEPLSAGLVHLIPSSQRQQGEKVIIWVVRILNDSPSLILAAPGVNIL